MAKCEGKKHEKMEAKKEGKKGKPMIVIAIQAKPQKAKAKK